MKIVAVCCTHNRPHLVSQSVGMFLLQNYTDCQMLVYDVTGQYQPNNAGPIHVVSERGHYDSFGTIRNLAIRHAATKMHADAIAIWDDDDQYFPWHLEAGAYALQLGEWAAPSIAWDHWEPSSIILSRTCRRDDWRDLCYHGSWCYKVAAWEKAGGYQTTTAGDSDGSFKARLYELFGPPRDMVSTTFPDASYMYTRSRSGSWHASEVPDDQLRQKRQEVVDYVGWIRSTWPENYMRGLPMNAPVQRRMW